ncbi:MAG: DnaJ domain-containing protein [Anaerolineales bacterium]|nr:DnaJ domain-containing protein [Anaerolineales bacterium]
MSSSKSSSKTTVRDPYATLQIDRRATGAEIKTAYFRLVRDFPPEKDADKFQEIRAAYEQLRTPERRAQSDMFLLQPPPPLPTRRSASYDLTVHVEDLARIAMEWVVAQQPLEKEFRIPDGLK